MEIIEDLWQYEIKPYINFYYYRDIYRTRFATSYDYPYEFKLCAEAGLTDVYIPRFRGIEYEYEEGRHWHRQNKEIIVIYTRTGGGNREDYEEENNKLKNCPNFISEADEDGDCTFIKWKFKNITNPYYPYYLTWMMNE